MYQDNQCWFGGSKVHYQREAVCQVCGGPQWSGGTYWHWRRDESWVRFLLTVNAHLSLEIPCHIHILDFLLNECTCCCGIPWDNLIEFYSWTSFLLHPLLTSCFPLFPHLHYGFLWMTSNVIMKVSAEVESWVCQSI